jgi:hypothetical protein
MGFLPALGYKDCFAPLAGEGLNLYFFDKAEVAGGNLIICCLILMIVLVMLKLLKPSLVPQDGIQNSSCASSAPKVRLKMTLADSLTLR